MLTCSCPGASLLSADLLCPLLVETRESPDDGGMIIGEVLCLGDILGKVGQKVLDLGDLAIAGFPVQDLVRREASARQINHRPCKCLRFPSPFEVFPVKPPG